MTSLHSPNDLPYQQAFFYCFASGTDAAALRFHSKSYHRDREESFLVQGCIEGQLSSERQQD